MGCPNSGNCIQGCTRELVIPDSGNRYINLSYHRLSKGSGRLDSIRFDVDQIIYSIRLRLNRIDDIGRSVRRRGLYVRVYPSEASKQIACIYFLRDHSLRRLSSKHARSSEHRSLKGDAHTRLSCGTTSGLYLVHAAVPIE